ncbi:hypothetical protein BHM03_00005964 [Ensete ventricosum]|nr:hypothetical protein BHM03_00005964 [Ensete ventricosum]
MEGVCLIAAGGRDTGMVRSFLEYDSLERTDDGRPMQQASVDLLDACPHVAIIERSFHRVAPWTVRWRARAGRWVAHLVPDLLLYTSPCSASKPVLGAAPFPPYLGRLKKEKKKHKMVGIVVRDGIHGGLEELEGRIPGEVERRIPEEARGILQRLASSWSDVVDSMALEVVPLKGAMTNEVYQVNWPTCAAAAGKRPRTVLVRIYGEGVDVFFDREEEIRTFECWLKVAKSFYPAEEIEEFCLDALEEEIMTLENELSEEDQRIGFCHNDLQYGNIMIDEETRVDYEYASFNPVAYDLANHFCEMAADYHSETPHILDYSKYPDHEERQRFVKLYLGSSGKEGLKPLGTNRIITFSC